MRLVGMEILRRGQVGDLEMGVAELAGGSDEMGERGGIEKDFWVPSLVGSFSTVPVLGVWEGWGTAWTHRDCVT